MKKHFYISSFIVLGMVCALFIYGLASLYFLRKNISLDGPLYFAILVVTGAIAGYYQGVKWWRIIYVEKAYLNWKRGGWRWKFGSLCVLLIFTIALILFLRNYAFV